MWTEILSQFVRSPCILVCSAPAVVEKHLLELKAPAHRAYAPSLSRGLAPRRCDCSSLSPSPPPTPHTARWLLPLSLLSQEWAGHLIIQQMKLYIKVLSAPVPQESCIHIQSSLINSETISEEQIKSLSPKLISIIEKCLLLIYFKLVEWELHLDST